VVAFEAERFVVLVTPEKMVDRLGARTPIPIEVVPFAEPSVTRHLRALGGAPTARRAGDAPYRTDNGNAILDTDFGPIDDPARLDAAVRRIPGVVDDGIFLDMASLVLVGDPGQVRKLSRA
jgi:ribose 5-phosphate isomerase A